MLAQDAPWSWPTATSCCGFVRRCLAEPDYAAALGERAQALVVQQLGATEHTLQLLAAVMEGRPASSLRNGRAAA